MLQNQIIQILLQMMVHCDSDERKGLIGVSIILFCREGTLHTKNEKNVQQNTIQFLRIHIKKYRFYVDSSFTLCFQNSMLCARKL